MLYTGARFRRHTGLTNPVPAARRAHSASPGITPAVQVLEGREVPAVVAMFSPAAGILTVFGDAADNTITVSRDAAGKILVNGGAVPVLGGTATVANMSLVQVF